MTSPFIVSRGTIYVKNLKSSTGVFSQREGLSLEDIDSLKVGAKFRSIIALSFSTMYVKLSQDYVIKNVDFTSETIIIIV